MKLLKRFITALETKALTISLAESCTGGYASYLITRIPGSSKVFKGGIIVYSLFAKNKLLNLPRSILNETKGVSKEVCVKLAKNVRKTLKSDIGASVVGFAGPDIKRSIKTGTVYIAVADRKTTKTRKFIIKGSRDLVRKKASYMLIEMIYKHII